MGSPVSLLGGNVLLDLDTMEEPVLRCFLSEFRWLSEDGGPLLNSLNVLVDIGVVTSFDSVWEHPNDITNILDSFDDFSVSEMGNEVLSILLEWADILHASLKIIEMVISSESIDETSSEVWNEIDWRKIHNLFGDDNRSNTESKKIGKIDT